MNPVYFGVDFHFSCPIWFRNSDRRKLIFNWSHQTDIVWICLQPLWTIHRYIVMHWYLLHPEWVPKFNCFPKSMHANLEPTSQVSKCTKVQISAKWTPEESLTMPFSSNVIWHFLLSGRWIAWFSLETPNACFPFVQMFHPRMMSSRREVSSPKTVISIPFRQNMKG